MTPTPKRARRRTHAVAEFNRHDRTMWASECGRIFSDDRPSKRPTCLACQRRLKAVRTTKGAKS